MNLQDKPDRTAARRAVWLSLAVVALAGALLAVAPVTAGAAVDLGAPAPWMTVSGSTCTTAPGCTFIQSADDGANSYVAPSAGVITSYTILAGSSFTGINAVGLRVFRPQAAGAWMLAAASASDTELTPLAGTREAIPTRVAVQAGDHLGLSVEFDGDTAWQYSTGSAADVVQRVTSAPPTLGASVAASDLAPATATRLNVSAHLEGDADGDGYGDGSQDACPLDPDHHAAPCTPPAVTGLAFSPVRFRVNPKGAVVKTAGDLAVRATGAARAKAGSSIDFTLTQPAQISFVVSRKLVGRRDGRKCDSITRRNRGHKHCVYYESGHHWNVSTLPAGANVLPYSGRYKHGHGTATLKPGRYRLTAVPGNAGGGTGPVAIADFTVVAG